MAGLPNVVPWGRSPLGENELELTCTGQGPVHGFPMVFPFSGEGCYKDISIIVYETDCIIIRSRVVPTHFTDVWLYSSALGRPGAKGTFRVPAWGESHPRGKEEAEAPEGTGHCSAHPPTPFCPKLWASQHQRKGVWSVVISGTAEP